MEDLRLLIKIKGIKMYQISDILGIGSDTLYRWLRKYDANHYDRIMKAINQIEGEHE